MALLDLVHAIKKLTSPANVKYLTVLLTLLTDEQNGAVRKVWEEYESYFVDPGKARRQALSILVDLGAALGKTTKPKPE